MRRMNEMTINKSYVLKYFDYLASDNFNLFAMIELLTLRR